MAQFEAGAFTEASRLSGRAIETDLKGEERARALWIHGVANHERAEFAPARDAFKLFIAENPNDRLIERARTNLALICEDMGDLESALEQYLALDYDADVAYLVDVLMTPEQVERFVEGRELKNRDELIYSAGVRYLRDGRLSEARRAFSGLRLRWTSSDTYRSEESQRETAYSKESLTGRGVNPQWVARDLQTTADLERLNLMVRKARTDEDKARALYQLANYHCDANAPLYHNPAIWQVDRYVSLSYLSQAGRFRTGTETDVLWRHFQAHEPLVRAIEGYLEIVDRYPNSSVAPDALFRAAESHQRLANWDEKTKIYGLEEPGYWPKQYSIGRYPGGRFVTYDDVRAKYPNYELPNAPQPSPASTAQTAPVEQLAAPLEPSKPVPAWKRHALRFLALHAAVLQRLLEWQSQAARKLLPPVMFVAVLISWWLARRAMRRLLDRMQITPGRSYKAIKEPASGRPGWRVLIERRLRQSVRPLIDARAWPLVALQMAAQVAIVALLLSAFSG
jgi:outer membrane protein assembly factor BamD (BamD/ComL family)